MAKLELYEVPTTLAVYVPKLDDTVSVPVGDATADVLTHIIQHGLKQKLVDATAGINAADFDTKDAYMAKVREAVAARLATVLTIPSERAFGPRNPTETEYRHLVAAMLRESGLVKKSTDAAERTSTFAKAREAYGLMIGHLVREKSPKATDEQVGAVVVRNHNKLMEKAEAIVAERAAKLDVDIAV